MRQASFFPLEGGGKYHAALPIDGSEIALCRTMILDRTAAPIVVNALTDKVHPICCRRCLALVRND